jgi:hypothetical protein
MHGLKSAISAIFQKSADWLDWPCTVTVSVAVYFRSQDIFSIFIYFSNMKPSSEEAPVV